MKRNQSGFTLIEIAIVLVIIGLLLGGVLKGQELINSAKVKNLTNDLKGASVMVYSYQDKFHAVPGDDAAAATHLPAPSTSSTVSVSGTSAGNGVIGGVWNSQTVTDESFIFWQHVRLAGLSQGETSTATPATFVPHSTFGGQLGVTSSVNGPISTMTGPFVACADNVPGKAVKQMDANLDDGVGNTGSVQAIAAAAAAAAATPADDTLYTVCMSF
ncbi:MAG: prepilin-type N-terminal cleavage/methylation domain-containing protein [Gallionella sp.]|nr:prepilin-type N-terminal cleavage/methylation domain-containing protein [Gallionella sp.]